jgi:hypothetical protein
MLVGVEIEQAREVMRTNDDALTWALANTVVSLTAACELFEAAHEDALKELEELRMRLKDLAP